MDIKMNPPFDGGFIEHKFGGAAGYCPPVQKVTDYLSTSLVRLIYLRLPKLKNKHKCPRASRGKLSFYYTAAHSKSK
jgi:hypothetical protein